jgi:predicted dehydrogenase
MTTVLNQELNREPVDLALFGVGRWGSHWLRLCLAHPQIRLRSVVDASSERLAAIARDLPNSTSADRSADRSTDWPADNILLTSDWRAAMQLEGLAGCLIATPAATHYELIDFALSQKRHVLAEKPLTLDVAKAQKLCDRAAEQQRHLVIDHTYLFHSAVTTGKQAISTLGTPRYGYATRTHLGPVRQDVDALWDLAIHDIAIFHHWLGEHPVRVQAYGNGWLQPQIASDLALSGSASESASGSASGSAGGLADVVWCRLQYPSGFEATLHLCWANLDKQRRLCVVGDRATLIFDEMNTAQPLTLHQGNFITHNGGLQPQNITTQPLPVPPSEPLKTMCDHFVACVQNNEPSTLSPGSLGTAFVKILVALSHSLKNDGQWMTL